MKGSTVIYYLVFASTFIFIRCAKHSVEEEAPPLPIASITFLKPNEGDKFKKGDSINIKAIAISTDELHGFDLLIRRVGDNSNYFFNHIHDHGDTVHVDQTWLDTLTSPANLEAELTIYLDHEGHTQKAKIGFTSQ